MLALHVGKSGSMAFKVPSSLGKQTKVVLGDSSSGYPFGCSFVEVLRLASSSKVKSIGLKSLSVSA